MVHLHYLVPLALHEQYVAILQTVVTEFLLDILLISAYAEDIYRIVFTKA